MPCLDTDFLVALLRRKPEAESKLEHYVNNGQSISTTTITACELYKGAYLSRERDKAIIKVSSILRSIRLLTLTNESCEMFGRLSSQYKLITQPIGELDLLIASIVITANETLATRNIKHFSHISSLKLEPW